MELLLHRLTERQLAAIEPGSGSIVLVGPVGLGRTAAATGLAQRLNCPAAGDSCSRCHQIATGNFPDLITLDVPGNSIGIAEVERLQEQLLVRPYYGDSQRLVVIEPAERLTLEAQNRFLKTLEEPPPRTLIVLIATNLASLLPTVRSRCQIINFLAPTNEQMARWLEQTGRTRTEVAELMALDPAGPAELGRWANDPTAVSARKQLQELTAEALAGDRYHRLLLVPRLLALGVTPIEVAAAIRRRLRADRVTTGQLAMALTALGHLADRQAAKLGIKATLEGLMLEL